MHFTTIARVIFTLLSSRTSLTSSAYPFEESLTEAQLTTFHKLLDCVSDTAAAEMRAAYKVGFKDSVALMKELQD